MSFCQLFHPQIAAAQERHGSAPGGNVALLVLQRYQQAVGLELPFQTRSNPIPWINTWLVSDNVQVAPQEVEVSSYLVGQIDSEVNTDDLSDFQL